MLVRNEISTTERVITEKGECNDNHSPLACRQLCTPWSQPDISSTGSWVQGQTGRNGLRWFHLWHG